MLIRRFSLFMLLLCGASAFSQIPRTDGNSSGGTISINGVPCPVGGSCTVAGQSLNVRGAWAASTAYAVNDVVTNAGSSYVVTTAYTSGSTFSTANMALLAAAGTPGTTLAPATAANQVPLYLTSGSNNTTPTTLTPTLVGADAAGAAQAITPRTVHCTPASGSDPATAIVNCITAAKSAGYTRVETSALSAYNAGQGMSQEIDLQNITLILPDTIHWGSYLRDDTKCQFKIYNGGVLLGDQPGGGGSGTILDTNSGAHMLAYVCTDNSNINYIRAEGFEVQNNGGATFASGYQFDIENLDDESKLERLSAVNPTGSNFLFRSIGCGAKVSLIYAYASNGNGTTASTYTNGGIPITWDTNGNCTGGTDVADITANAPGPGLPNVLIKGAPIGQHWHTLYMEGNGAADTTTAMVQLQTSVAGVDFDGVTAKQQCAANCPGKYAFDNASSQRWALHNVYNGNGGYVKEESTSGFTAPALGTYNAVQPDYLPGGLFVGSPAQTDNSQSAANTAWVRTYVAANGGSATAPTPRATTSNADTLQSSDFSTLPGFVDYKATSGNTVVTLPTYSTMPANGTVDLRNDSPGTVYLTGTVSGFSGLVALYPASQLKLRVGSTGYTVSGSAVDPTANGQFNLQVGSLGEASLVAPAAGLYNLGLGFVATSGATALPSTTYSVSGNVVTVTTSAGIAPATNQPLLLSGFTSTWGAANLNGRIVFANSGSSTTGYSFVYPTPVTNQASTSDTGIATLGSITPKCTINGASYVKCFDDFGLAQTVATNAAATYLAISNFGSEIAGLGTTDQQLFRTNIGIPSGTLATIVNNSSIAIANALTHGAVTPQAQTVTTTSATFDVRTYGQFELDLQANPTLSITSANNGTFWALRVCNLTGTAYSLTLPSNVKNISSLVVSPPAGSCTRLTMRGWASDIEVEGSATYVP